jgi:hypothetical protein
MKKIYILAAGLLSLLAAACNKDDSTGASKPVPQLSASGLKDTFNVFTHKDFLKATPVVQQENDFDFYWTLFSANFTPGQGLVKADTLARTKDLNYEVLQDPGPYMLVFNARHKTTGVVRQLNMVVNITTLTMNGWYLVKDNGGKTDMDFIHSTGRIDNWIANFNNGKSLNGNAVKAVFAPAFKATPTSPTLFNTLALVSENDAAIYRVDNGAMVMNFDNMFFTKPATRKPQSIFQPMSTQNLTLINDGQAYNLVKGTLFSNFPVNYNNLVYNNLSPITAVAAMGLGWSPGRKSVFCYDGSFFVELKTTNGSRLQNMNADLKWMTSYAGGRSVALMLFRNPQDTGYLFKLNVQYGPLIGSGALVMATDTLKPEHNLMHADAIGGNYDVDLIYYAVGDKIYMTDVATATENLQFTLPAGETVTAIQHIKYPQPASTTVVNTLNYIAIATYKAGRYKVYLHTISGTGTLSALSQASFEGEGRVSTVIYMEQGNGSRVF